jgi:hypothetical protein
MRNLTLFSQHEREPRVIPDQTLIEPASIQQPRDLSRLSMPCLLQILQPKRV